MADATFAGYIKDLNGDPIQCKYQMWHKEEGQWNTVAETAVDGYFSKSLGDGDWLTQSNGATGSGETVLIAFWKGDGAGGATADSRAGAKDVFGVTAVSLDGSSSYVIDTQVLAKTAPTGGWALPNTGTIDNELDGNLNVSDENADTVTWDYSGVPMKHDANFHGVLVFDGVGDLTNTYDYKDGNGFVASDKVTYDTIGDYATEHKVVSNVYDATATAVPNTPLETVVVENVRIKYNVPTCDHDVGPTPAYLNDLITVTSEVTDDRVHTIPLSSVGKIEYLVDSSVVKTVAHGDLIYAGNVITDTFTFTASSNKSYTFATKIYWNDGFVDQVATYQETLHLANEAPTVDLLVTELSAGQYECDAQPTDRENLLDKVVYSLYIESKGILEESPETESWSLLETYEVTSAPYKANITFYQGGQFKIEAESFDTDGEGSNPLTSATSLANGDTEVIFEASVGGDVSGTQTTFFDTFE